jgi:hypothetical protein
MPGLDGSIAVRRPVDGVQANPRKGIIAARRSVLTSQCAKANERRMGVSTTTCSKPCSSGRGIRRAGVQKKPSAADCLGGMRLPASTICFKPETVGSRVLALSRRVMRRIERLYRLALRQSASLIVGPNQRSQRSLREISNPPISAVQISPQALSESLQFLWRLDARGDHIPKLIALAREDILTQLVVLQFVSCRLS